MAAVSPQGMCLQVPDKGLGGDEGKRSDLDKKEVKSKEVQARNKKQHQGKGSLGFNPTPSVGNIEPGVVTASAIIGMSLEGISWSWE